MKIEWGLVWALLLGLLLMPFAKGDVCQKGAQSSRIKMIATEDAQGGVTFQFVSCRGKAPCTPLGPIGASFSKDELSKKYDDLDAKRAGGKTASGAGSILGLFLFGVGQVPLASDTFDESDKYKKKAEAMKAKMKVLEEQFLSTDEACVDVPSLANHRTVLSGVLKEIVADRKKKEEITVSKVDDNMGAKDPGASLAQTPAQAREQGKLSQKAAQ
jgi:hypothetical protein